MNDFVADKPIGWLKSPGFDINFIGVIALMAITVGTTAYAFPNLAEGILFLNVWFLGYHHVIATYTRLMFDKASAKEHFHLITTIPAIVLILTIGIGYAFGIVALITVFFHWQWFHYTRQSWGIACAYRRQAEHKVVRNNRIGEIVFWSVPVLGIVHRSWQGWDAYWTAEMWMVPVNDIFYIAVICYAVAALMYWLWTILDDIKNKQFSKAYHTYLLSHFVIFYISYIIIPDISSGWLVVNIWHNAQYIAFVWLYNGRKFKNGIDPKAKFLSMICQPKNVGLYFLVCLLLTTAIYGTLKLLTSGMEAGVVAMLILYQTINYHHYIADSMIWRTRKKGVRQTKKRPYNMD